jgi:uncharacterized HAD superfamily protein
MRVVFFRSCGSFYSREFIDKELCLEKPKIGIDLDDTVVEFLGGFLVYHNRVYGGTLERHHFTTWNIHEVLGCTESEGTRRCVEFCHTDDHLNLAAVPGAQAALTLLCLKYDLIAITAREPQRAPRMLQVVKRLFGNMFTDVHFLGSHRKKGDLCTDLGVQFMVDDGLHNAHSVGHAGIRMYLMDRPWNQCEVLPPNTIRVFHWDDVLRLEL